MGTINFINAGAGSGKTHTLINMFCERLANGAKPSEFILTTYTKAAADEFRSKIKSRLLEEKKYDKLPLVESAHIGTIHSVAQSFIEKYWYLLDMSPALSVKEDDEMVAFRSRMLDSVAEGDDLTFYNYHIMLDVKKQDGMYRVADPDFWRSLVLELVDKMRLYGFDRTSLDAFRKSSIQLVEEIFPLYVIKSEELDKAAGEFLENIKGINNKNTVGTALATWSSAFEPFLKEQSWKTCQPILKVMESSAKWVERAPQDMFEIVRKYTLSCARKHVKQCVDRVFDISERLLDRIDEYKRAEGILEFSDLEVLFLKLLSYDSVKADLRDSIKYVFVDEFQDVSPIQLKIFQALGNIVQESCWVGDPKQAIYGFRDSDTSLVNSVIVSLGDKVKPLEYSHRSLPQLVNASNKIFINSFARLTESERLEKNYVELKPCEKKTAEQDAYGGAYIAQRQWWTSVPKSKGLQSTDIRNAKKVYPAVASELYGIFADKKYKVTDTIDGNPKIRDLRYGDVAILTRYNADCVTIAKALRAKGLPVSVLDSKLDKQAEVKLLLTLMKYIAGVDVNLTVAELRRLVDDEDLETILLGLAKKNDCSDLLQLLDALKNRYSHYSVYDMVKGLIAALDLRHMVCKWSMGQKRQSNLDLLLSMASSFVHRRKEASVLEFIRYVKDRKVDVPFDNTGDTIKVLTYHKAKGLQWKMVILNSLYQDSLNESDFLEKDFSKITVRTSSDGNVNFNLFPPVDLLKKLVLHRMPETSKAKELWDYLMEKKRAEELRLLYVGFTRAENYLISLSFGAMPSKWLDNTRVVFDSSVPKKEICDDSALDVKLFKPVTVLPYEKFLNRVEGKKKFISPSKCEVDPSVKLPACDLETIADNIDVARWNIDANVFGTCIHNYLAVHKWSSEGVYGEQNLRNAVRVLSGFGIGELISAENLVKQADTFFAYVERTYGNVNSVEHEIPFVNRKDGQVISGEIDLYVKTETGKGILVDFKNPMARKDVAEQTLKEKALKYWPQLDMYRDALRLDGYSVDHVCIYYPMLGAVAKFQ